MKITIMVKNKPNKQKNLNCLPEFFKDKEFDVDYDSYTARQFLDAFHSYLINLQKSRRFSNSLKILLEKFIALQDQDNNMRQKLLSFSQPV